MLYYFVAFMLLIAQCIAADLPSSIPHCAMNDPKLGNCILSAAIELKPRLYEGIKEIGIPTYDPLVLSTFDVSQESDLVNYTFTFWNYTIRGLDNYDITDIQYDTKNATFKGKIQFDPLSITAVYNLKGRFLFIPVRGEGVLHLAIGPINATFDIIGKIIKRKNVEYYDVKDTAVRLNIEDASVYFNGLFDDDIERAAMTNEIVNRYAKRIIDAATPGFEGVSERYIMRYFKWLTKKFPLSKLFPSS